MAKYSYITDKTHNNRKIQVESAKRDGSGKNFENNYAKQNGNYQSLTAGLSNNFDTKQVMVDESAYNFRPTATMGSVELEVGSPCKVKKIVGGSVAYNQILENLVPNTNLPNYGLTATYDSTTKEVTINGTSTSSLHTSMSNTIAVLTTHKYLVMPLIKNMPANAFITLNYGSNINNGTIVTNQSELRISFRVLESGVVFANTKIKSSIIDLTQMFGSTIADYIYSLEQANAGSGVAWFKRYFPKEYYAYNSGELVSVKTQGKKITHFNQWDEEWERAYWDSATGVKTATTTAICSKNKIKVTPSTTYYIYGSSRYTDGFKITCFGANGDYLGSGTIISNKRNATFTTPSNCYYIAFNTYNTANITAYGNDICINFHYDGERDGEYEPYNSETYPCDDIELRGIPQLDENNNLVFDGDEYASDGSVTRKYGIVDLGTLSWSYSDTQQEFYSTSITFGGKKGICSKYLHKQLTGAQSWDDMVDKSFSFHPNPTTNNVIRIKDTSLQSTDIPSGYLIYELATPTDENSIPFTEVQECDNWGTEELLAPTTDTRPCEVPVGHETDYLPDLKAKLEVAPTTPNENGVYVMEHNSSGNSYTPLATWLANNGYQKVEDKSSESIITSALSGVTINSKRVYKIGNMVFISATINNGTGATITANTILATISSQYLPIGLTSWNCYFSAVAGNVETKLALSSNGLSISSSLYNGSNLILNISYIIG